jgi:hypothetical protein
MLCSKARVRKNGLNATSCFRSAGGKVVVATASAFPRRGPFHLHKTHDEFKRRIRGELPILMLHSDFLDFWLLTPVSRRDIKGEALGYDSS